MSSCSRSTCLYILGCEAYLWPRFFFLKRTLQALKMFFSIDPRSSNGSAVSVRRAVEILSAGHKSHPGRRPPPHEGMTLKNLEPTCSTLWWFTFHVFFSFFFLKVALLDLQSNPKIAALLPYFVYVISGVCLLFWLIHNVCCVVHRCLFNLILYVRHNPHS